MKRKGINNKKTIFEKLEIKDPRELFQKKQDRLKIIEKKIGDIIYDMAQMEKTIYTQDKLISILREKIDRHTGEIQDLNYKIKENKREIERTLEKEQEKAKLQRQAQDVMWGRRPLI